MTNQLFFGDNLDVLRDCIARRTYPKLQILTLAELFRGRKPNIPFVDPSSIKRAKREETIGAQQQLL